MEKWKHLDPREQVYAAVITDGDNAVGLILDALKDAGVEDNTIVLFSSDNGPESPGEARFHDGQGQRSQGLRHLLQRGVGGWPPRAETQPVRGRGPRALHRPLARSHPAGAVNDTTVLTALDLLPTLCAAAGVVLPEAYKGDGENLLAAFKGESTERKTPIFWEWRPGGKGDLWPNFAVREGDWKLVTNRDASRVELYNPAEDRAESENLAKSHPETVARLSKMLGEWKATLPAKPDPACTDAAGRAKPPGEKPRKR